MASERMTDSSTDYVELMFHWHRYLAASTLASNKVVLDIACGEGYGSSCLAESAKEVIAVDIDENTVIRAKSNYGKENIRFLVGSATRIPCADRSIDLVVSFETIEHLSKQDQLIFLKEISRVLKDDGQLIISTPDRNRTALMDGNNPYHINELNFTEFRDLLSSTFKHTNFYKQEVNLASFIWGTENENNKTYKIEINNYGSMPTTKELNLHLYVLAVCGKMKQEVELDSFCYDINRSPIETLWSKLEKNSTVNESKNENKFLKEKVELLTTKNEVLIKENEIFGMKMELLVKEKNDLLHQGNQLLDQYRKIKEELGQNEQHLKKMEEKINHLTEDKEQYRKKITLLLDDKEVLKKINIDLVKDKEFYRKQIELVQSASYQDKQSILNLSNQLNEIYGMRTWKMINLYRSVMDKTLLGAVLRKLRNAGLYLVGKRGN